MRYMLDTNICIYVINARPWCWSGFAGSSWAVFVFPV